MLPFTTAGVHDGVVVGDGDGVGVQPPPPGNSSYKVDCDVVSLMTTTCAAPGRLEYDT